MKTGIDAISFYTSHYYLDLKTLAESRNIDVNKFYQNLGQLKMGVPPPGEDIVSMGTNAAEKVLKDEDLSNLEAVFFATESGIDLSKAAGTYVHKLLNLPSRCRVVELKQACYAATAGLQLALAWVKQNPKKKILLIAADIARYQHGSAAESSQGCGAVAMLIATTPRILTIEPESGFCTREAMDFWRPNYSECAIVDGRLSCNVYITLMEDTWRQYTALSKRSFRDHDRFCYHTPVPKLVEKTHKKLARLNQEPELTPAEIEYQIGASLAYNRQIGNSYTASLYLGIISLLENVSENLADRYLGLYSYGSGCVAEFFSAKPVANYQKFLAKDYHQRLLNSRVALSFQEYLDFTNFKLPQDGSRLLLPKFETGSFRFSEIHHHQRMYERCS